MYDYLTRSEVRALAVRLALYAVAFAGSSTGAVLAFWAVISAPYGLPDIMKVARLCAFVLALGASCGWYWIAGDALRSAAFLSFKRGLRMRGGR